MCNLPVPGPKPPVIADGGIRICRTMKDGMALSLCVNSTTRTIMGFNTDSADAVVVLAPIRARCPCTEEHSEDGDTLYE